MSLTGVQSKTGSLIPLKADNKTCQRTKDAKVNDPLGTLGIVMCENGNVCANSRKPRNSEALFFYISLISDFARNQGSVALQNTVAVAVESRPAERMFTDP